MKNHSNVAISLSFTLELLSFPLKIEGKLELSTLPEVFL
jgi:hypothetical protein